VSTVIPGARNVAQARSNASAGSVSQLTPDFTTQVTDLYDRYFRAAVHDRW
jgi:aryl-alcohol dehydrogenase-like predicted oxidoreductase